MEQFVPVTPIQLQIRQIIYEEFNVPDAKFTNDQIFEILSKNGDIDPTWIIDDLEPFFLDICKSGLARNIAQNFTTIWLKLFDTVQEIHCSTCNCTTYMSSSEDQNCPNCSTSL